MVNGNSDASTLNIDDDVLAAIRELARRQSLTVGQAASRLLRRALDVPEERDKPQSVNYGFRLFGARGFIVTNSLINEIRGVTGD